jgi:hypothetical protein
MGNRFHGPDLMRKARTAACAFSSPKAACPDSPTKQPKKLC